MPELPEVEALAADLRARVVGRRVSAVEVVAINALKTLDPPMTALSGMTVAGAGRFGKFLDIMFAAGPPSPGGPTDTVAAQLHLVVHLARAGWLHYRDTLPTGRLRPGKGPVAVRVRLADGGGFDLTEQGTQKRLAVYLGADPTQVPGVARLGPDPLTVDEAGFVAAVSVAQGQIKGVLTDQHVLAGVGNAYSDEILHRARLSPFAIARRLSETQLHLLYQATRQVLADAVTRSVGQHAASLKAEKRSGLVVHGRTGLPCPDCGDLVRAVSFVDSSLQYCPTCQTGGRVLADRRLSRFLR